MCQADGKTSDSWTQPDNATKQALTHHKPLRATENDSISTAQSAVASSGSTSIGPSVPRLMLCSHRLSSYMTTCCSGGRGCGFLEQDRVCNCCGSVAWSRWHRRLVRLFQPQLLRTLPNQSITGKGSFYLLVQWLWRPWYLSKPRVGSARTCSVRFSAAMSFL